LLACTDGFSAAIMSSDSHGEDLSARCSGMSRQPTVLGRRGC
jgi:hypothetical protein